MIQRRAGRHGVHGELRALPAFPRLPERFEAHAIGWKSEFYAELVFQLAVRRPFVLGIKTPRQRAQTGGFDVLFGRRLDSHQHRGVGDDILRRCRRVVAHVEDIAWTLVGYGRIDGAANVLDMDAIKNLSAFHYALRGACLEIDERTAAGAVNTC
jgi:hypothetical protein